MIYLSVISFIASFLYFQVGFYALKSNRKSELCRMCFLLTLSMTIWSFAEGFLYLADNNYTYDFWNKTAAFGWCTFEALVLLFVLTLIGNKTVRHWYVKLLILLPAFVFLFMVLFLFGPDIDTAPFILTIFYTGDFIYNFSYLLAGILLILHWGMKSKSKIQKRQAQIIVIASVIPFTINLFAQNILPYFHILNPPNMGQIYTLIMLFGVNNAITKYQFLSIPTSQLINELFNELTGFIFLSDSQGRIMKTNKQVHQLLGYKNEAIIGKFIYNFFDNWEINKVLKECDSIKDRMKFSDITISTNNGEFFPINVTIIPIATRSNLVRGILVIGEDIRTNKLLQDEIIRNKMFNEKLQNSELLLRKTLEITPVSILIISKDKGNIIYLNAQAVEMFTVEEAGLRGKDVSTIMKSSEDKDFLTESFKYGNTVKRSEISFKRLNGTEFIGLVTAIRSVFHDEDVVVACVVDMTEHKKVEETLKLNNEYIVQLNKELMDMNDSLKNKSIRDGLTNLYNHQFMNEVLENKLREYEAFKENLCLMMMDIDHFKRINDNFGHLTGDKVLTQIADIILNNTRMSDYIGRYGGEEFIVILPDTELETAAEIAESIREEIYHHQYGIKSLKVSISIGVVQYSDETLNAFINKADVLLYRAKSNGRNRVEIEERK